MTTGENETGAGTVVPIRDGHGVQRDPALARIESYWTGIRAGRLVPSRSEIDPRGLEGVLSHAFILERLTTGLARLRIAGSHMSELLGIEARGMPLSAVFAPASRQALAGALESVFDEPATVRFALTSETGFRRPDLTGGMVLLPLRSDLGDITRVLGGVSLAGTIGRVPRRLEITGQSRRSLTGYAARPGEKTARITGFAEPRHDPQPEPPADARRRGHLRLVVANDE
ncbi:MAG: PAS domain-containing protein [Silicimonas sp.]